MRAGISAEDVVHAAARQLYGKRLVTNVHRGFIAETIVSLALDDDWEWCSGDYSLWDFIHISGKKLEIKQSATRQSWHVASDPPTSGTFDIRPRKMSSHRTSLGEEKRWADIYVFAHHYVSGDEADHRDPAQWLFYVVEEKRLPSQQTLSLSRVRSLSSPVSVKFLSAELTSLLNSATRSGV